MRKFKKMINALNTQNIKSWEDLNFFLKGIKQDITPHYEFRGSFEEFKNKIRSGGIAIVTYGYGVDGVSVEICKYIRILNEVFGNIDIHLIGKECAEIFDHSVKSSCKHFVVKEMAGFAQWKLFDLFFRTKLKKGDRHYRSLLKKFWKEVLLISNKIGRYISENNIKLLYLVNTNSNPGNVSLALSMVFISEYLQIPVISNNHDFYWEAGSSEIDRKHFGKKPGSRDHYFTNCNIDEFFSIIKMIYPWKSRMWFMLNINQEQSRRLVHDFGHDPENVWEIGTAIDSELFKPLKDENRKTEILKQISNALSNDVNDVRTIPIKEVISKKSFERTPFPFVTGYKKNSCIDISLKDIILVQPTRVIERKNIQKDFELLQKLTENDAFRRGFQQNNIQNIILLITGPLITGHYDYFLMLLERFEEMLNSIDKEFQSRIFVAFLFSEIDRFSFKIKHDDPVKISDIFSIASMITLPSKTEGRGLPIIEAASCGIPIFTKIYYPKEVYRILIGEHLSSKNRLKVIEFDEEPDEKTINEVVQFLFEDKGKILRHNRKIIQKRFCFKLLKKEMETALYKFYCNLASDCEC
ncbi:MAG: hypothetical protein K8R49_00025 [Candidatus Cloacimonetes bacterium]|nr:hypothetical protein [Candidatus Cloacimonadota bacterium]